MVYAAFQMQVTDLEGNVVPYAKVEIRGEVSGYPRADIYTDRDGTILSANPVTADSEGFFRIFARGSAYRVNATLGSFEREWRYVAIGLGAETDIMVSTPKGAWNSGTTYAIGDLVSVTVSTTVHMYISLQNTNLNHAPDSSAPIADTAWWMYVGVASEGPPGIGDQFDIPIFLQSYPRPGEIFPRIVFTSDVTFPATLSTSFADAGTPSTSTAVIKLYKNGVQFGTLTFSAGIAAGVFSAASDTDFEAEDVFTMEWPAVRDDTLANVSVTIHGNR